MSHSGPWNKKLSQGHFALIDSNACQARLCVHVSVYLFCCYTLHLIQDSEPYPGCIPKQWESYCTVFVCFHYCRPDNPWSDTLAHYTRRIMSCLRSFSWEGDVWSVCQQSPYRGPMPLPPGEFEEMWHGHMDTEASLCGTAWPHTAHSTLWCHPGQEPKSLGLLDPPEARAPHMRHH